MPTSSRVMAGGTTATSRSAVVSGPETRRVNLDRGTVRGPPRSDASGSESNISSEKSLDSMERAKLLGYAGDPERTPDIPEDTGPTRFARGKNAAEVQKASSAVVRLRYCCLVSLVGGALLLAVVLAAPTLHLWSSSAHIEWPGAPFGNSGRGRDHDRDSQFFGQSSGDPLDPVGTVEGLNTDSELCNVTAPVLRRIPLREWNLTPVWRRACEEKNHKRSVTQERNWCWIGVKRQCHWNLKNHFSWSELQHMAAKAGSAPPVSLEPFNGLEHPHVCDRPELGRSRNWTPQENASAKEWFKRNIKVYVLNLPSDRERWQMIAARLMELEIEATRIDGVDMRIPGALWTAKRKGWVKEDFNFTHSQHVAYSPRMEMGSILGTLGCAAAHFKVQTQIIADGPPLAIVLEDDSWLSDDFVPRLWSLVREELPCDWHVTALYSRCPYGICISPRLARIQPDANEPEWRCRQGVNWGMHAILYRRETLAKVQRLWKQTVFHEDRPRCMDVDVALASISDRVSYYAVPNVQDPGFVKETNHRSARWDINQAAITTSTSTSTSFVYVPRVKPGEPWPGAWNFG